MTAHRFFSAALICLLLMLPPGALAGDVLQVHQLALGCANGYLVMDDETVILVDCGLDTDSEKKPKAVFEYLSAAGFDHLDAYFITHYHNDHAFNAPKLIDLFASAGTTVLGPTEHPPAHLAHMKKAVWQQLSEGDELDIGNIHVYTVGPAELLQQGNCNSDSLAFVLRWKNRRILFTGDYLHHSVVSRHGDVIENVDVFQFPHHGLKPFAITGEAMLRIAPKVVLVPGKDALPVAKAYRALGLDPENYSVRSGNIVIELTADSMEVHTRVKPGEFTFGRRGEN